MEVMYRTQPIFGAQPAAMVFPSTNCPALSPPMFAAAVPPSSASSSSQPYTCYSFQASPTAHSPSRRTPTPEWDPARSRPASHYHHYQHHHHPSEESVGSRGNTTPSTTTTTLKSVLRGEVPEAYSHFLSTFSSSPSSSPPPSGGSSSMDHHHHRLSPLGKRKCPFVEVAPSPGCCSPLAFMGGRGVSTTVLSPPPEDVQTEPMDLSFKRPCSSASASSSGASSPASFHHTFPPSPAEEHQGHSSEFSLLRNLLQVGKTPHPSSSPFHHSSASPATPSSSSSASSDRGCDSPCSSESGYPHSSAARHLCGSTRVTLAKKNMYPVSARVSDWLVKVVQFARSVQYFREELTGDDQVTLLLNSWSRLLLLFMAESNFQFVVTPLRSDPVIVAQNVESTTAGGDSCGGEGGVVPPTSPDEPTMKAVEAIQTFIRKCQHMGVEGEEYYYLRMLVLFNSGNMGVSHPAKVDSFNSQIQKSLQTHVHSTRPRDVMHYSRLLMCLPSLYGIGSSVVERLFCKHIHRSCSSSSSFSSASSSSTGPAGDLTAASLLRDLLHNMDR